MRLSSFQVFWVWGRLTVRLSSFGIFLLFCCFDPPYNICPSTIHSYPIHNCHNPGRAELSNPEWYYCRKITATQPDHTTTPNTDGSNWTGGILMLWAPVFWSLIQRSHLFPVYPNDMRLHTASDNVPLTIESLKSLSKYLLRPILIDFPPKIWKIINFMCLLHYH